jgi:hypothetical protein
VKFYIKEWRNGTATLMTSHGRLLWTFPSVASAQDACQRWYQIETERVEYCLPPLGEEGIDARPA